MIDNMRRSWGVGVGISTLVVLGVITEPLAILLAFFGLWCWLNTCWLLSWEGA